MSEAIVDSIISSEVNIRAVIEKLSATPDEIKAKILDVLLQRMSSAKDLKGVCDVCVWIAQSLGDLSRLYLAYDKRSKAAMDAGSWWDAREDMIKMFDILPKLRIDTSKEIALGSPLAPLFTNYSDVESIIGRDLQMKGSQEEASKHFQKSLDALIRLGPDSGMSGTGWYFEKLGDAESALRDFDGAVNAYLSAKKDCESPSSHNSVKLPGLLCKLGQAFQGIGDYSNAENYYRDALNSASMHEDADSSARANVLLASLYMNVLSRFEDARNCAESAFNQSSDDVWRLTAMHTKGAACLALGYYRDALACHRYVAEKYRTAGLSRETAMSLATVASDLSMMGRVEESLKVYQEAINLYTELNDSAQVEGLLCQMAADKAMIGLYEDALEVLDEAGRMASGLPDHSLVAKSLVLKGDIHLYKMRAFVDAERSYTHALNEFFLEKGATDSFQKVKSLTGLSDVALTKKQFDRAEQFAESAIGACESSDKLTTTKASCFKQLAGVYAREGKDYDAVETMKKAVEIYSNLGMKRDEAGTYRDLAMMLLEAKRHEEAFSSIEKAMRAYSERGLNDELILSLNIESQILYDLGKFGEALSELEKAIKLSNTDSDPGGLAYCYAGLGAVQKKLGKQSVAIENLTRAADLLDSLRASITSGDLRISFQSVETAIYGALVSSYFELGEFRKCLEFIERGKSRVMIEEIRRTKLRKPEPLIGVLGEKEDELTDELNAILNSRAQAKRASEIDSKLRRLWRTMEKSHPDSLEVKEYLSMRRGEAASVEEIHNLLKGRGKCAILEYYVLKDKLIMLLLRDGGMNSFSSEVGLEELRGLVLNLLDSIVKVSDREKTAEAQEKLSSYLIRPVAKALDGTEHLHIIPQSFLNMVPFHSLLIDEKMSLVERCSLSYSSSASVLRYLVARRPSDSDHSLVLGASASQLTFAEKEAKEIGSMLGCTPVIGDNASKDYVRQNIGDKRVISFSCHAKFDPMDALNSSIILPTNEPMTAREWLLTKISPTIVTLSACETAESEERPGDEMLGLIRSLIYAGAKSIVASLWRVDDFAAYLTMTRFYKLLIRQRTGNAESLRQAQLYVKNITAMEAREIARELDDKGNALMRVSTYLADIPSETKVFAHPYYWAPFILAGDWL